MASASKVANGDIKPYRFVKLTTTDGRVLVCGAGDQIYGVSQAGTHRTPLQGLDDGFAASSGENLNIWIPPEKEVLLLLGGTVVQGDHLKSDADGAGVVTTSAQDEIGAIASFSGVSGQIVPVQIIAPQRL